MKDSEYQKLVADIERNLCETHISKISDQEMTLISETFYAMQHQIYGDNICFSNMTIDNKVIHGWNRGYLYYIESILIGRYNYIFDLIQFKNNNRKQDIVNSKIPQISFKKNNITVEMLKRCLDCKYTDSFDSQKKLALFIDWILYSFGDTSVTKLPNEISKDLNEYWYKEFKPQLLLAFPYDYFGELAEEYNIGKGGSYFATPHDVCEIMSGLLLKNNKIGKFNSVNDPCGGSGRTLLFASNKSLRLYYQDINQNLCNICKINAYLYMPCIIYGDYIEEIYRFINLNSIKELNGFDWSLVKDALKNKKVENKCVKKLRIY